jgi:hypothetical protein
MVGLALLFLYSSFYLRISYHSLCELVFICTNECFPFHGMLNFRDFLIFDSSFRVEVVYAILILVGVSFLFVFDVAFL